MEEPEVPVRATVHLADLRPGEIVDVNPRDPYIAECLEAQFLVPVDSGSE